MSGPQSLNVNQQGTWTVTAYDKSGGNLSYSVVWGDEVYKTYAQSLPTATSVQQSATFTHSYSQAGNYTPTFTVANSNGQSAQTSLSVNVGGVISGNTSPKITTVSPIPTNIQPGQTVSFSWSATDANNDDLSWSVDWGDSGPQIGAVCMVNPPAGTGQNWNYSASRAWANAGAYTVKVSVGDCKGGSDSSSFTVNVGSTTQSSITVLSPNGGETWTKGTIQTIKWVTIIPSATCPVGATNCYIPPSTPKYYDIKLVSYNFPCTSSSCPPVAYPILSYAIANSVYDFPYSWPVGTTLNNTIVPDGSYTIQVCQTGTTTCDSSDSYFKIISGVDTNSSPKLGPIAVLANISVGQSVNFNFSATDANNDDLSWSIDWGESGPTSAGTCMVNPPAGTGQNWNYAASHAWATASTYTVKVIVSDCKGGSDSSSFIVNVGGTATGYDLTMRALKNGTKSYNAGQTNVIIGEFEFKASTSKDITINDPGFLDFVLNANGIYNPSVSKDFRNLSLWVGGVKISQTFPEIPVTTNLTPGALNFIGTSFNVARGSAVNVVVRADIAQDAGNASHYLMLAAYNAYPSGITSNWGADLKDSVVNILGSRTSTPTISSLSPTSGMNGTQVTIYGSGFTSTGNKVNFGQSGNVNDVGYNSTNGNTVVFQVPSYSGYTGQAIQPGVYAVSVINANGTSNNLNFTVTSGTTTSTTITSISPTSAKVGDTVTIYGLNFDTVAPFIYLTNGYLAKVLTPITSSSTQISFSVPSDLSVGAYTVQAISRANSTSSDNSVYFTVVAATTFSTPTISSLSPTSGPIGTNVVITGAGFSSSNTVNGTSSAGNFQVPNVLANYNQTMLGFTIPSTFSANMGGIGLAGQPIVPGIYQIQVGSAGGSSNNLNFTVSSVLGAESFNFTQVLQRGSQGNEVMELQKFLNGAGYDVGTVDGKFGLKTEAAVVQFETANKLNGDGVVGHEVRALLNK